MVTHDLRMCRYVDRVIQMLDGELEAIIEDKHEIELLAQAGHQPQLEPRRNGKQPSKSPTFQPSLVTA